MGRANNLLPFMDILTGLVGVIILINIILALSISESDTVKVRILLKEESVTRQKEKLVPVHVVCEGERITVRDKGINVKGMNRPPRELELAISSQIESAGDGAYVLALVKPSGYDSFRLVREIAEQLHVRIGYEPVNTSWVLAE